MLAFTGHDMSDHHLAQYVLVSSMRKLDQGRRSKTGIQLERGLLIAVTALKARQTLWEQDLKLRGFYNSNNVYAPLYPPLNPIDKSHEIQNTYQNSGTYYKPTIPESSSPFQIIPKPMSKNAAETDYYDDNEMDDNRNEDSLSDESTDEELLQDEEMNRMVRSTISESEPEHWRFLLDESEVSNRQNQSGGFAPGTSMDTQRTSQTWTTLEVASAQRKPSDSLPLNDINSETSGDSVAAFPSNKRKRRYSFSDCKSLCLHQASPVTSILS